jgi:hypothetical protein
MKLMTNVQRAQLLANGRAAQEARREGRDIDPYPVVKFFTPDADCTWLLTELDPDDPDRAFGLGDLGQGCPELGYVSLREIERLRGLIGLAVERDLHFEADKPLSAYADEAREHSRIIV